MILIFAGTSDAREYITQLAQKAERLIVCTATKYGASLIEAHKNICKVIGKPLDEKEIMALIECEKVTKVVDATHPYAQEISSNIKAACEQLNIPVEKRVRDSYFDADAYATFAEDYETAAKTLAETSGNILLTIGSRRLKPFAEHIDMARMIIRVLPTSEVLLECEALGFAPKQIIAIQGPFSSGFNSRIYEDYDIKHMVTKDSGKQGGVEKKVLPALERGVQVVVIKRPEEA